MSYHFNYFSKKVITKRNGEDEKVKKVIIKNDNNKFSYDYDDNKKVHISINHDHKVPTYNLRINNKEYKSITKEQLIKAINKLKRKTKSKNLLESK